MARTLTCTDERWNCDYLKECEKPCQHHVGQTASDAQPPLADAIAAVHSADFVGVLELLPEALCIVEYRKTGMLGPDCTCAAGDAEGEGSDGGAVAVGRSGVAEGAVEGRKRVAHVMNSRRQRAARKVSVTEAPAAVLRQLDEVLSVDMLVYRAAVMRVLCDLKALEHATGQRVLCHSRLAKLRNKTHYVPGLWDGGGAASALSEWADARRVYETEASSNSGGSSSGGGDGGAGGGSGSSGSSDSGSSARGGTSGVGAAARMTSPLVDKLSTSTASAASVAAASLSRVTTAPLSILSRWFGAKSK